MTGGRVSTGEVRTSAGISIHWQVDTVPAPRRRMVLLHAAGGSSASWDEDLVALLTQHRFEVLRLDLRDSGRSTAGPAGAPDYGLPDLAADVAEVLQHLGWTRSIFLGAALGAAVAESAARTHPELCAGLVLVSPLQADRDGTARIAAMPPPAELLQRFGSGGRGETSPSDRVRYLMRHTASLAGTATDPVAALRIARAVQAHAADLATQVSNLPQVSTHLPPALGERPLTCPVLVVCGAEDPVLPIDRVVAWLPQLPHARMLLLAGAGHGDLPADAWTVLVEAIRMEPGDAVR